MAAKAAGIESVGGCMIACNDKSGRQKTTQQPTNKGISKSGRWWAAMTATIRCNGDATATMMDGNGRCNGNAMMAMEPGGNGGGAPTSDGRHRGMFVHYGRASVHLELSSFGYKYGAPPHCSWDCFTYARPLLPLDVRDLNRAPRHVSKFNGLLYPVRRSLLNPPRGRANDDRRRDCDGNCNNDDVYGNNGG